MKIVVINIADMENRTKLNVNVLNNTIILLQNRFAISSNSIEFQLKK